MKQFLADESGQAMTEYGIVVALLAVALIVVAISPLGKSVFDLFDKLDDEINSIYPGRPW